MKIIFILTLSLIAFKSLSQESKFIISLDKKIYQNYEIEKRKTIQNKDFNPECGLSHESKIVDISELDSYCIIGEYQYMNTENNQVNWKCKKENEEVDCYAIIVEEEK